MEEGRRLVSTGPHAVVRHPMCAGAVLMILATPMALGSLWALAGAVPLGGLIVLRLLEEERHLSRQLAGYEEYRRKVRHCLVPCVW